MDEVEADEDLQDGLGWTPLMIASSIKDGEALARLFLGRDADVNAKSACQFPLILLFPLVTMRQE